MSIGGRTRWLQLLAAKISLLPFPTVFDFAALPAIPQSWSLVVATPDGDDDVPSF